MGAAQRRDVFPGLLVKSLAALKEGPTQGREGRQLRCAICLWSWMGLFRS